MREYFEDQSQDSFADVIDGPVAEALCGTRIGEIRDAHSLIRGTSLPTRLQSEVISAVDVALYDRRGNVQGTPVYDLLAEEYDTRPDTELPLYASAGMYMDPPGYVEQALVLEDLGFFGYKYRPGIGPAGDRETVERLVKNMSSIEVMLDAHSWWKLREGYDDRTVRDLVIHATEHDAFWIEEPVEPGDDDGYLALSETGAPLAGGESEPSPERLVALARTGAVDFLQGDVRHHEGFTGCWEAVSYCAGREVEFVPHNFGTWLGLIANAHLVAAAPDVSLLEYPVFENDPVLDSDSDPGMYPFELAFDIITERPAIEDGVLSVPDGPGLGVDVDLSVIEDYPFEPGPWTEFHYDDA